MERGSGITACCKGLGKLTDFARFYLDSPSTGTIVKAGQSVGRHAVMAHWSIRSSIEAYEVEKYLLCVTAGDRHSGGTGTGPEWPGSC